MLNTDGAAADESVIKVWISTDQSTETDGEAPGTPNGESNTNSVNLDVRVDNGHSSVHIHHTTEESDG